LFRAKWRYSKFSNYPVHQRNISISPIRYSAQLHWTEKIGIFVGIFRITWTMPPTHPFSSEMKRNGTHQTHTWWEREHVYRRPNLISDNNCDKITPANSTAPLRMLITVCYLGIVTVYERGWNSCQIKNSPDKDSFPFFSAYFVWFNFFERKRKKYF
jgi:hypothetical protein